ncbi:hypothetical protein [Stenotrophomonas sp. MMGLT7]|uniref:hypothetical protein n=1 Tax=Stenotrophomonas sp. MMGLT7 TaxID=2901227 RepID=UPI001E2B49F0|nr:hypothetical protein [Stenotrophomonas sp. MMGLT7]MCD7099113.1 hypothetical protein [Stenotrophomonas sp. MMGLT7]
MHIPGLTNAFLAGAAIAARRITKHGAADGEALQAAAATDALNGISTDIPTAAGMTVDVTRSGLAAVEYGGAVAAGQPLTADAQGRAVAAAPAAGANVRIIGFAEVSGVLGDIGSVWIAPGVIQGA